MDAGEQEAAKWKRFHEKKLATTCHSHGPAIPQAQPGKGSLRHLCQIQTREWECYIFPTSRTGCSKKV